MRKASIFAAVLPLIIALFIGELWASEGIVVQREGAEDFAVLPDGVRFPEGITANPENGDIYVGTFDFGPNPNKLLRFNNNGQLVGQKDFDGTPLLGLEFNRGTRRFTSVTSARQRFSGLRLTSTRRHRSRMWLISPALGLPPREVWIIRMVAKTRSSLAVAASRRLTP